MRVCRALILVAALAVLSSRAGSAQTFYSTGTNVVANIDQNWLVATGFGAWSSQFEPAHFWDHGTQRWISYKSSWSSWGPAPWFTFRQTFDLTGYDPSTAALRFRWGCDDVPQTGATPFTPVLSVNGGAFG